MNMNQRDIKVAEEIIARLRDCCRTLQQEMSTVLIGQDEVVRLLLTGLRYPQDLKRERVSFKLKGLDLL